MVKITKMTKITRLVSIPQILDDLKSEMSDEEVMKKHGLNRMQMAKVYTKLLHGGLLRKKDLARRLDMRLGKDVSHIPLVRIKNPKAVYECLTCGFLSPFHFSECPKCRALNLRKLTKKNHEEKRARAKRAVAVGA